MVEILATDDGLIVNDSILCLDSYSSGHLSFLSSALNPFQKILTSVITTEETQKILRVFQRNPNALICQYNRPFSIGKLQIELLPSGGVLGGASLYVETGGSNFLYAPMLQANQKLAGLPAMQLKPVSTMILNAPNPPELSEKLGRENEVERFRKQIRRTLSKGVWPVVFCHPIATAQEITQIIAEEGVSVSVHPSIYKINKIYESCGVKIGSYSCYSPRKDQDASVLVFPFSRFMRARPDVWRKRAAYMVQNNLENHILRYHANIEDKFFFSLKSGLEDVKTALQEFVRPKRILVFGPYSIQFVRVLRSRHYQVQPLFQNRQPVLF